MKLDPSNKITPIKSETRKPIKKQEKLIGSMRKKNNLTLYEYDLNTHKIDVAKNKPTLRLDNNGVKRTSVIYNENCLYGQYLNRKSARKKFTKRLLKVKFEQLATIAKTKPSEIEYWRNDVQKTIDVYVGFSLIKQIDATKGGLYSYIYKNFKNVLWDNIKNS